MFNIRRIFQEEKKLESVSKQKFLSPWQIGVMLGSLSLAIFLITIVITSCQNSQKNCSFELTWKTKDGEMQIQKKINHCPSSLSILLKNITVG